MRTMCGMPNFSRMLIPGAIVAKSVSEPITTATTGASGASSFEMATCFEPTIASNSFISGAIIDSASLMVGAVRVMCPIFRPRVPWPLP